MSFPDYVKENGDKWIAKASNSLTLRACFVLLLSFKNVIKKNLTLSIHDKEYGINVNLINGAVYFLGNGEFMKTKRRPSNMKVKKTLRMLRERFWYGQNSFYLHSYRNISDYRLRY